MSFTPTDPHWEEKVRDSFGRQPAMETIGASLAQVSPGHVVITLNRDLKITQQHGFIHGGVVGMIADSAAGYAAFSLFPAQSTVVTVEYKINFLLPAVGERLIAHGRVKKAGKTLSICDMDVFAADAAGREQLIATGVNTLMCLPGRADAVRV